MTGSRTIKLGKYDAGVCEQKWFGGMNKQYRGDPPGARRSSYIYIRVTKNAFSDCEIDLDHVQLWNPFPEPRTYGGHYFLLVKLKDTPAGFAPLGIAFAEAMVGQPWPQDWDARYVACLGSIATFSRACSPQYPRPERDRSTGCAKLSWRPSGKLNLSERVGLYPLPR